jgi:hypothetical protein
MAAPRRASPWALDLDFTRGVLDPRISFSRASPAWHFNSAGVLVQAAANAPRFAFDPVTLQPLGLQMEAVPRTNSITNSSNLGATAWGKTDAAVAQNAVGITRAVNSAWTITEGSAGTAILTAVTASVAAGSTITGYAVLKRGNTDWVRLLVTDSSLADGASLWINMGTVTIGTVSARGAGTLISAHTPTNLGDGWYLIALTVRPNGTYTAPSIALCSAVGDSSGIRVNGSTYLLSHSQLEVGASPSSPIITTGAAITRAADVATIAQVSTPSGIASASEFTLYSESLHQLAPGTTLFPGPLRVMDGAGTTRFEHFYHGAPMLLWGSTSLSGATQGTPFRSAALDVWHKCASRHSTNNLQTAVNGALGVLDTTAAIGTADRVAIGVSNFMGYISAARVATRGFTDAELTALTA